MATAMPGALPLHEAGDALTPMDMQVEEEIEALEGSAVLMARATASISVDSRFTTHGADSFSQARHARVGAEGWGVGGRKQVA